ncbi:hypothetical protein BJ508DRAFT_316369 [Ascobolus immersus RN42]|uniref:Uncharacterized protein n=1 Tax=Ascobolus immersus RN42 TaxID=1160509 RepID=A0A3N4H6N7_ASCIM|nr:hypothetical protein BJ508DRAFT_316369 [Ascobolus immersus RN42]
MSPIDKVASSAGSSKSRAVMAGPTRERNQAPATTPSRAPALVSPKVASAGSSKSMPSTPGSSKSRPSTPGFSKQRIQTPTRTPKRPAPVEESASERKPKRQVDGKGGPALQVITPSSRSRSGAGSGRVDDMFKKLEKGLVGQPGPSMSRNQFPAMSTPKSNKGKEKAPPSKSDKGKGKALD